MKHLASHLLYQIHGEKIERYRQLEMAFPAPTNHYAYERRGW